jgi:hypothetical protein
MHYLPATRKTLMNNHQKMQAGVQKWKDHLATLSGGEYTQFAHNCAAKLGEYAGGIESGSNDYPFLYGVSYPDLRMAEDFFRSAAITAHRSAMESDTKAILGVVA